MALRDLVADQGKLTEEAIESIIKEFVRYDPGEATIIFTPESRALSNESRILVYLVAVLGWKYVVDEEVATDTKPAALESAVGIPGGTLRPLLKKLKDSHLLSVRDGSYHVRPSNLGSISRSLAGEKLASPRRPSKKPRGTQDKAEDASDVEPGEETSNSVGARPKRRGTVPIRSTVSQLVQDGWFKEDRTLGELVERLHEMAIIAKLTSLSGPVAELVRKGNLKRKKVRRGNKEVWAYKDK